MQAQSFLQIRHQASKHKMSPNAVCPKCNTMLSINVRNEKTEDIKIRIIGLVFATFYEYKTTFATEIDIYTGKKCPTPLRKEINSDIVHFIKQ